MRHQRTHFISQLILGFISAYEYAICLVFMKNSDIARHLILVWYSSGQTRNSTVRRAMLTRKRSLATYRRSKRRDETKDNSLTRLKTGNVLPNQFHILLGRRLTACSSPIAPHSVLAFFASVTEVKSQL